MNRPLGLRIDVDTHEGMRDGVPRLLDILRERGAKGTFYLAMGPDRSGMAVFNLLKPGFLSKMRRSGAGSIYSLRTKLSGTLLPARPVATAFPGNARRIAAEGHEVGTHGWDHRSWQDRLLGYSDARVGEELERAREAFRPIFGRDATTAAAPAWLTDGRALVHQDGFGMDYATDCRGSEPFLPVVGGEALRTPQVPCTLPTLDEALGRTSSSAEAFYQTVLEEAAAQAYPVFTVHAEIEGGPYAGAFGTFLDRLRTAGLSCVPLGEVLGARSAAGPLANCALAHAPVAGRHGVVSMQADRP